MKIEEIIIFEPEDLISKTPELHNFDQQNKVEKYSIVLYTDENGVKVLKNRYGLTCPWVNSNSDDQFILTCGCNSVEHQIIITQDPEENLFYCHIHLINRGFFRRLLTGLKYIFGYKCRFGHWDEFVFDEKHAGKLLYISNRLRNKDKH